MTGALLVVVAAGVLAYGIHDLQEGGLLPGLDNLAFDISDVVDPTSWYAAVLKGVLNFSPQTTWLEAIAWVLYVSITLPLFIVATRRRVRSPTGRPTNTSRVTEGT